MPEIPKAYEPGNIERKWYNFWLKQGYFTPEIDPKKKTFRYYHATAKCYRRAPSGACSYYYPGGRDGQVAAHEGRTYHYGCLELTMLVLPHR